MELIAPHTLANVLSFYRTTRYKLSFNKELVRLIANRPIIFKKEGGNWFMVYDEHGFDLKKYTSGVYVIQNAQLCQALEDEMDLFVKQRIVIVLIGDKMQLQKVNNSKRNNHESKKKSIGPDQPGRIAGTDEKICSGN